MTQIEALEIIVEDVVSIEEKNSIILSTQVEELEIVEEDVVSVEERQLIVFNDDFNTFDHVIQTLIDVCNHTPEQAEQCTWIIHYKGKCAVKHGSFEELKPMRDAICDRGISAEVA